MTSLPNNKASNDIQECIEMLYTSFDPIMHDIINDPVVNKTIEESIYFLNICENYPDIDLINKKLMTLSCMIFLLLAFNNDFNIQYLKSKLLTIIR